MRTIRYWTVVLAGAASLAVSAPDSSALDRLEGVVIISRHGNRSPIKDNAKLNRETSNTWPTWNAAPGQMTPRGRRQMVDMGSYYRAKFTNEGLLTGNDAQDVKHAYFHTNTIPRTVQSGCALAEGLFPSTTTTVHFLVNKKDALYEGGAIDDAKSSASINGRIGIDEAAMADSMRPQFDLLERTLGRPGLYPRTLASFSLATGMSDAFMCEYCEGMSGQQFAFGRATPADLREMLKLLAADFDLQVRTPYLARMRASNIVSHITSTLQQIAARKAVKGAFGDADDRLYVIVGHDSTIAAIAGLLELDWVLPDAGRNICPPGGALVFEVRRHASKRGAGTDRHFVRVYFASETLAQLHDDARPSLENAPTLAPIFVPGASTPGAWYDSPLQQFVRVAKQAIDPTLVVPVDDGQRK